MNSDEYQRARNKVCGDLLDTRDHSAEELKDIGDRLNDLKQAAGEAFKEQPVEDLLKLENKFVDMLNRERDRVSALGQKVAEQLSELQSKAFIDTTTPEERANIAALSAQYLNEFRGLKEGDRVDQFMTKVLSSRLGAHALLGFPQEFISDAETNTGGKVPRRYINQALELSKSTMTALAEETNTRAIEGLEKEYATAIKERLRMTHMLESIKQSRKEDAYFPGK